MRYSYLAFISRLAIIMTLIGKIILATSSSPIIFYSSLLDPTPIEENYSRSSSPIASYFEVNQGQADSRFRFLSRVNGYTLFLGNNEAIISMHLPVSLDKLNQMTTTSKDSSGDASHDSVSAVLRLQFVDANKSTQIIGVGGLQGKVNYFIGNDPEDWFTNIPTYSGALYKNIYPGIDLHFYINQDQLEFDFKVNSGSNPSSIRLAFPDADELTIDAEGDLLIKRFPFNLKLHNPTVYQGSTSSKQEVLGSYEITETNQVSFMIGAYNTSKPLVIDPIISYSTYLGGRLEDSAYGISVDSTGNIYVSGKTQSDNFPTTPGTIVPTRDPCDEFSEYCEYYAFLSKFTPSGNTLIYSTYIGPVSQGGGIAVAVDDDGNTYLSGTTYSSTFPTTPESYQPACDPGPYDNCADNGFITKLNPTGSSIIYSTFLGGAYNYELSTAGHTGAFDIAIDAAGNAYVAGDTQSLHFPTTKGAFQVTGYTDAFVTKIDPTGSNLVYSTYLGGPGAQDTATSIALDTFGNAYVTGYTYSTGFPLVAPYQNQYGGGASDAFVTKLNSAGSALIFSTYLGGSNIDSTFGIAVDGDGNSYVTGQTKSVDFPVFNPLQTENDLTDTYGDGFVTKFNPQGTSLVYSTFLGGILYDYGVDITVDRTGNAYVTGNTESFDFPSISEYSRCYVEPKKFGVFLIKINGEGSTFVYSKVIGSGIRDQGNAIAINELGNVYLAGVTWATYSFPTTIDAFQKANGGWLDAFFVIVEERYEDERCLFLPLITR